MLWAGTNKVSSSPKDSLKLLSRNLGITGYLCPKLNQNPWCPYAPGKDGYMFVGLGGDAVRLVEPYVWPLFVNVSEDQSSKLFFSGFYEVCKAEDVTVEEWSTVPDHIKSQYCQTTKDKVLECYNKPLQQIKAEYQSGSRRAPCRRLRFVGWRNPSKPNMDIYQALVDHFSGRFRVSGSTQDSASVSPAK
ncbi:hypothetical protein OE88DRAFT_837655 [Heliocybe sulcata]|uniref:DUF6697 domain-containing protein n=1 Tax=Heliocybe sulcata TaxID=5364 RepID=A0A5C3MZI1_9AGAM|nr:hypothetical protein OE88DRAFT_837655 [Heliocybe sulcata]